MNMQEIRSKASQLGLQGISRLNKGDLVRAIQQAEGNTSCFGAEWRFECAQTDCCWRGDCQKPLTH